MRGLEGAEPARIDNKGALGRPSAPFEGKPVGGAMRSVRVQRDFALQSDFGAAKRPLRASTGCLRAVPSSRSSRASRPRGDGA